MRMISDDSSLYIIIITICTIYPFNLNDDLRNSFKIINKNNPNINPNIGSTKPQIQ